METLDVPLELKASGKTGSFEGYGAVFGNKDLGDDIILAGAFEEVKTTSDGKLRIALYHDLNRLIGKAEFSQDDHGLHVRGQLNMNVSYAKDAFELMKDGSLDGMSVGFDILPGGSEWRKDDEDYVRIISKAELWEVSIVPFGMNPEAKIDSVKQAFLGKGLWAFESYLKGLDNFSRKEAMATASYVRKLLQRDAAGVNSDQGDLGSLSSAMLEEAKDAIAAFKI